MHMLVSFRYNKVYALLMHYPSPHSEHSFELGSS